MLGVCFLVSIVFVFILCIITKGFHILGWRIWLPIVICLPIVILSFIMIFIPNGAAGITQYDYFGIGIYALIILMLTAFWEAIILLIKRFLK